MKSICVVGAGASGLACIKESLASGLNVTCYEQSSELGGLWRYHEEDNDDVASVTKATVINSSKELSAYSDFPPDETLPNYCHHTHLLRYFSSYADTFGLRPFIKFNHKVVSTVQQVDGKWLVKTLNISSGHESDEIFDGIMVATGHHCKPHRPQLKGLDKFTGTVIHTHSYKRPDAFVDKKVLIVGMGNSAGDAAVELSSVAEGVTLSTRSGSWVLSRVYKYGLPMDYVIMRRFIIYLALHLLPYNLVCWLFEWDLNHKFDHQLYGVKPKHRVLGQHPFVNDALANRILSGTVTIKGDVDTFTERGAIFSDDLNTQVDFDAVILATGYETSFSFLPDDICDFSQEHVDLFKYAVNPNIKKPESLMFIGLIQPYGPLIPISELQARWFCQLQIGSVTLPSRQQMMNDIEGKKRAHRQRYYSSPRHKMQVDFIDFMDEIADQIAVRPSLSKYFFTDLLLWWHLIFGPSVPYQYRLEGPGKWSGARQAIITVDQRISRPLAAPKVTDNFKRNQYLWPIILLAGLVPLIMLLLA